MLIGQEVTVLGAGIGGLSVALALALQGAKVRILEQSDAIREVGAGLQVSPNGMAVLTALGVGEAVAAAAIQARAINLLDCRRGAPVLRLDLSLLRPDQPYRFVHRADLIDILAEAARSAGVEILLSHSVTSVKVMPDGVQLRVAGEGVMMPGIAIASDGVRSLARTAVGPAPEAEFTRQVAWRATVPMEHDVAPEVRVFMGPGQHLVAYPLRDGRLLNLVAVQERSGWADEGWHHRDNPTALIQAFQGFAPEVRDLLAQVHEVHLWGLFRHPVAETWHRGGLALLGDAAHPTLPFLAQGACMALEDAWVLATCLASDNRPQQAFAQYQALRRARCVRIVEAANFNARAYHLSSPPVRFLAHTALRIGGRIAPESPLRRFDWLYGHDVTKG